MNTKPTLDQLIAISPPAPKIPQTFPENETQAQAHGDYIAARKAEIEQMCKGPVVWSSELSTNSRQWGYIWRGDFWEPKRKSQRYPTRVVCWTAEDGGPGMCISTKWGGEPPLKL